MIKAVVATITKRYGGIDISVGSLLRQDIGLSEVAWIVIDELYYERIEMWYRVVATAPAWGFLPDSIVVFPGPEKRIGDWRNLAASYNLAGETALERFPEAKLFVSMQDYIWVPPEGLGRFLEAHEAHPEALVSGLTSISSDPEPNRVCDPKGHYTIYAEPFLDKPEQIAWADVRGTEMHQGQTGLIEAIDGVVEWETNWAAVPLDAFRKGIRFDLDYDRGVAYENQAFALRCIVELGYTCYVDLDNHSISLPHKAYSPHEEVEDGPYINRMMHELKMDAYLAQHGYARQPG